MSALIVVVEIILILLALVLIVAVLMQEGQSRGLGAIGGGAETFFGKNKAKSYEGKLALITKVAAVVFIVLAIVCTILVSQVRKSESDAVTDTPAVEETADAEVVEDAETAETAETEESADEAADSTEEAAE